MSSGQQRSAAVRNGNTVVRGWARQGSDVGRDCTMRATAYREFGIAPPRAEGLSAFSAARDVHHSSTRNTSRSRCKKKGDSEKYPTAASNKLVGRLLPPCTTTLLAVGKNRGNGIPVRVRKRKVVFPDAPYLKSCRLRFFQSHYVYIRLVKRRHDILTPSHCRGISAE